ncbi:hypothetical protein B0H16DRAFT_1745222 [Mycena metata]|uniref:Uncharacterized protein n=1 Tax=Mycena metata TaxID=1033252 RepID=A0AAD7H436_9AGAR|nr:hypothetical protein B0H16DRAFT_1745222 [Mycena metata]
MSAPLSPPRRYVRLCVLVVQLHHFPHPPIPRNILQPRPPLNLDVLHLFASQRPVWFAPPRALPALYEFGWDPENPDAVRPYSGPEPETAISRDFAPPFVSDASPRAVDPDFVRWIFNMDPGPVRGLRLDPPPHRYLSPRRPLGSSPLSLPTSFSLADVAHEAFLSYALFMWYSVQILGPHGYQVLVIWARRREGHNYLFRYAADLPPMDLAARLHHEMDILAATIELFNGDPVTNAEELLNRVLRMEHFLFFLSQHGTQVAYSQEYEALIDSAIHYMQPTWDSDQRLHELRRVRARVARRSRFIHPRAPATIRLLPQNWEDPRIPAPGLIFNEDSVFFDAQGMLEALDGLAEVGDNGCPLDDLDLSATSAILEGVDLDVFISESLLDPREFHGASIPRSPSPPPRVPTPVPPPPPPPPPPTTVEPWLLQDFVEVPPSSPPSCYVEIPSRRRKRASSVISIPSDEGDIELPPPRRSSRPHTPAAHRHATPPTVPRTSRSSKPPPHKRSKKTAHPEDRTPRTSPRLRPDSTRPPVYFANESHRRVGAVVRQLRPGCPGCGVSRFCTEDTDPNEGRSNKPRTSCYHCAATHVRCSPWRAFSEAFHDCDERALSRFFFEFWEHLGGGHYQPLEPDPRVSNLHRLARDYSYRNFLYEFLPLQNTDRSFRRRQRKEEKKESEKEVEGSVGGPPPARSSGPKIRIPPLRPRPDVMEVEEHDLPIALDPRNFDSNLEPTPLPSQQASSSRGPGTASHAPAASGSPRPPAASRASVPVGPSDANAFRLSLGSEDSLGADTDALTAYMQSIPEDMRVPFLQRMASVAQGALGNLGSAEKPKEDRKGKGKARE